MQARELGVHRLDQFYSSALLADNHFSVHRGVIVKNFVADAPAAVAAAGAS